ncbi:hypothetical protein [Brevibacillus massiliensis]|uniref:hypothetical protein n=1 Tax=Brevibacillus massiliensis TaxID=1118054 RepID=UPI000371E508|nr:hypothetical protein [Brevibacillus massiliensis]
MSLVWGILAFIFCVGTISCLIGSINPKWANKNLKNGQRPITRKQSFIIAVVSFALCLTFFNLATPDDSQAEQSKTAIETVQPSNETLQDQSAMEEKTDPLPAGSVTVEEDKPLPADPEETKKLKPYYDFAELTYSQIYAEYNKQKKNTDLNAWSDFAQQIREKIETQRKSLNDQFPIGAVSGGNKQNIFSLNDVYQKIQVNLIKEMWDDLEGKDNELPTIRDEIDSTMKKITFQ